MSASALPADVDAIDALLPQTQCMRCGFAACRPYAEALAAGSSELNRCPPGGEPLIAALAARLDRPPRALDPACGSAAPPRRALIDPARCTGCARCLPACPVDAIVGARRMLHTVLATWCTGCELCLPACPVDCIDLLERPDALAAAAPPAALNRARFQAHQRRRADSVVARARLLAERKRTASSGTSGGGTLPP